jgi:hypothetical protein
MTQQQRLERETDFDFIPGYNNCHIITAKMLGDCATYKDAERAANYLNEIGYFCITERTARKENTVPYEAWSDMLTAVFNN